MGVQTIKEKLDIEKKNLFTQNGLKWLSNDAIMLKLLFHLKINAIHNMLGVNN